MYIFKDISFSKFIEGNKRSLNMTLKGIAFFSIAFALVIASIQIIHLSVFLQFFHNESTNNFHTKNKKAYTLFFNHFQQKIDQFIFTCCLLNLSVYCSIKKARWICLLFRPLNSFENHILMIMY